MSTFKFKQFEVDQTGCAMRINTDGVLLAALVSHENPQRILDIGTGTGVIALMLAQRFMAAAVAALEIDDVAAFTAQQNFEASVFHDRLTSHHCSIQQFSSEKEFDLIVSNPPFFVNDLKNVEAKKGMARHATDQFFTDLINKVDALLADGGSFWLILPIKQAQLLIIDALHVGLFLTHQIKIHSDESKSAFRWIICFSKKKQSLVKRHFYIYESEKVYTQAYQSLLKEFFIGY